MKNKYNILYPLYLVGLFAFCYLTSLLVLWAENQPDASLVLYTSVVSVILYGMLLAVEYPLSRYASYGVFQISRMMYSLLWVAGVITVLTGQQNPLAVVWKTDLAFFMGAITFGYIIVGMIRQYLRFTKIMNMRKESKTKLKLKHMGKKDENWQQSNDKL